MSLTVYYPLQDGDLLSEGNIQQITAYYTDSNGALQSKEIQTLICNDITVWTGEKVCPFSGFSIKEGQNGYLSITVASNNESISQNFTINWHIKYKESSSSNAEEKTIKGSKEVTSSKEQTINLEYIGGYCNCTFAQVSINKSVGKKITYKGVTFQSSHPGQLGKEITPKWAIQNDLNEDVDFFTYKLTEPTNFDGYAVKSNTAYYSRTNYYEEGSTSLGEVHQPGYYKTTCSLKKAYLNTYWKSTESRSDISFNFSILPTHYLSNSASIAVDFDKTGKKVNKIFLQWKNSTCSQTAHMRILYATGSHSNDPAAIQTIFKLTDPPLSSTSYSSIQEDFTNTAWKWSAERTWLGFRLRISGSDNNEMYPAIAYGWAYPGKSSQLRLVSCTMNKKTGEVEDPDEKFTQV